MTDPKPFLLSLLSWPTGVVIYSRLLQGSTFGYSIPYTLLAVFLQILLFRQGQVPFPCILCTHFILMCGVIFISMEFISFVVFQRL